jgi:hypothetical protein
MQLITRRLRTAPRIKKIEEVIVEQLTRAIGNRMDLDGGKGGGYAVRLANAVYGAETTGPDKRQGDQHNK